MIYLDHGATSFPKPLPVRQAVAEAMTCCANPGRGSHRAAMAAAEVVYDCRAGAARLFHCLPEQVAFTANCTQGLNIAIRSLFGPGDRVAVSGFEHNAVTRTLHGIGAEVCVAGRRLFDWEDTLEQFEDVLRSGVKGAVVSHVSNVFGYILPVEQMGRLCRQYGVPFVVDGAQSAGHLEFTMEELGADFIAMPGHKGLLGPMGTGMLLCGREPKPLLYGGTGSESLLQTMPEQLPERLEAGTVNVPGIAGLKAGMDYLRRMGIGNIHRRECRQVGRCAKGLEALGFQVFHGTHQSGTVSFLPKSDCEEAAQALAARGFALRAGLHCAPLAHESAGTLETGTLRISFGYDASDIQTDLLLRAVALCTP